VAESVLQTLIWPGPRTIAIPSSKRNALSVNIFPDFDLAQPCLRDCLGRYRLLLREQPVAGVEDDFLSGVEILRLIWRGEKHLCRVQV